MARPWARSLQSACMSNSSIGATSSPGMSSSWFCGNSNAQLTFGSRWEAWPLMFIATLSMTVPL